MINLVRSEFYRLFNRVYLFVFWGVLIAIALFTASLMDMPLNYVLSTSIFAIIIPVFLWPFIIEVVSGEEFKDGTFINSISYGVSKTSYYVSKIIVSAVIAILTVLLTVLAFMGGAMVFGRYSGMISDPTAANFFLAVISAMPLYIAAMIAGTFMVFVIKKNSLAILAYFFIFLCVNPVLSILKLLGLKVGNIVYFLITNQLIILMGKIRFINIDTPNLKLNTIGGSIATREQMLTAAVIGFVYIAALLLISIPIVKKR